MWSSGHRIIARSLMLAAGLAVGLPGLPALASPQAAAKSASVSVQKAKANSKSRKKTPEPSPVETPPPAPLLPYQLPPKPPRVTFLNGQLTIVAENATLASVMDQIRTTTGAAVETGSISGGERVSVRLGPGAPRDVIADLLNGSNYNYVLLGSLQDPQALERVIVTQRGTGATTTFVAAPSRAFPVTVRQPAPPPEEEEIEPETEEAPEVQQVPAETTPAPPEQANPQATPQPGATPGTPAAPGQTPQVKTPQELLQELQERMRKQQEEQNPERNQQQRQQQEEEPE